MVRESKRLRCHLTRLNRVLVVSLNLPSGVKIQQITPQMWSFKQMAFLPPSSLSAEQAEKRIYQRCKLAEVIFLVEQLLIRTITSRGKISHTCRKKNQLLLTISICQYSVPWKYVCGWGRRYEFLASKICRLAHLSHLKISWKLSIHFRAV